MQNARRGQRHCTRDSAVRDELALLAPMCGAAHVQPTRTRPPMSLDRPRTSPWAARVSYRHLKRPFLGVLARGSWHPHGPSMRLFVRCVLSEAGTRPPRPSVGRGCTAGTAQTTTFWQKIGLIVSGRTIARDSESKHSESSHRFKERRARWSEPGESDQNGAARASFCRRSAHARMRGASTCTLRRRDGAFAFDCRWH